MTVDDSVNMLDYFALRRGILDIYASEAGGNITLKESNDLDVEDVFPVEE